MQMNPISNSMTSHLEYYLTISRVQEIERFLFYTLVISYLLYNQSWKHVDRNREVAQLQL